MNNNPSTVRAMPFAGTERTSIRNADSGAEARPGSLPVGQIATVVGVSNCCGAAVVVEGHTTHWYACYECGMPCDVVKEKEASNGNG